MASIVERRGRFCVVYSYKDKNGKRRQKWETYKTMSEAKKRKKEIEYRADIGQMIVPHCKTVKELLEEYVNLYGKEAWALSTLLSGKLNDAPSGRLFRADFRTLQMCQSL